VISSLSNSQIKRRGTRMKRSNTDLKDLSLGPARHDERAVLRIWTQLMTTPRTESMYSLLVTLQRACGPESRVQVL